MRGVSVILPTVRIDDWLDDAVQSILDSSDVEIDLIVVHDGVEPDPLLPWMKDPRVQAVHHQVRRGLPAGLMSGLEHARFELIGRLDADDLADRRRLGRQADYLTSHSDTVAVGTRTMNIDGDGHELNEFRIPVGDDIRSNLLLSNAIVHSSVMFRKSDCLAVGGFDTSLPQMEDYDLWLRMACLGPIANLDEVLTYYRVHAGQMSRGAKPFGIHIARVMTGRANLRRHLKAPVFPSIAKDIVWRGVQFLRYYGIIRPGYER
ncbi:glycosyltransferase [Cryobacterium suzukii]|uniref:Glycosyltransferase n=1 Tax=Cryobacterium suzukii TaxID=1259198 RepID=A0A4V3ISP7_9MICO|nr:glycosyltransferase [Cryobacterium suzukii]TFD61352.1 glycosyltransferase [Cryobacterium suzukii]